MGPRPGISIRGVSEVLSVQRHEEVGDLVGRER